MPSDLVAASSPNIVSAALLDMGAPLRSRLN